MLFKKKKIDVEIIKEIDVSSFNWCTSAKLVSVIGTGAIETVAMKTDDDYYGYRYLSHIKLNGVPLAQMDAPSCPTCASLISTGYGIDTVDCPEIKYVRDKLNMPFVNLEHSIKDMLPLLGLLQSGVYVVADIEAYPTDGNGHFFWEVNDLFTKNPATSEIITEDYDHVDGIPAYLYPTQNTKCFDENRVEHYQELYKDYENAPRTIVYKYSEFINLILDGHHKACAAAKLGKRVKCIAILPYSGLMYNTNVNTIPSTIYYSGIDISFSDIPIDFQKLYINKQSNVNYKRIERLETNLINRIWEDCYHNSARYYPDVTELAEMISVDLDFTDITNEKIDSLFSNIDEEKARKLRVLILYLSNKTDRRTKELALKCAKTDYYSLKFASFNALSKIENDEEIEQFFINHLIDDNDKHSVLRDISSSYLDRME